MMKSVGAQTRQIVGIYFGVVLILGLVALVIAMPAGIMAGRLYANFAADMLNFDIFGAEIPAWVYILQVVVGLLALKGIQAQMWVNGSHRWGSGCPPWSANLKKTTSLCSCCQLLRGNPG